MIVEVRITLKRLNDSSKKKNYKVELEEVLKSNNILLDDIWLFGSQTDAVSDVDIIIVYKKLKKIIFSAIYKEFAKGWNDHLYSL